MNLNKSYYVHPTAVCDDNVTIGRGSNVWHFCHISSNTIIGDHVVLGHACFIGRNVTIGNRVKIQNHVSIFTGVELRDDVFIGPNACFTNILEPRAFLEQKNKFQPTLVGEGASIGANATILCGVTVGSYALIGAGSVVLHDVKNYEKVVGNPARPIGWVDSLGAPLCFTNARASGKDGREYSLNDDVVSVDY